MTADSGFVFVDDDEDQELKTQGQEETFSFVDDTPAYTTPYDVDESRLRDTKSMSIEERMQLAQDLKTEREYRTAKGVTKGAASGTTLGLSEYIPGMAYEEGDYGFGVAEAAAELTPIMGLAKVWGIPAKAIAKSPILSRTAGALSRVLHSGGVGGSLSTLKTAFKGEIPTMEDVFADAFEWIALDGMLHLGGAGARFVKNFINKGKAAKESSYDLAKTLIDRVKKSGVDPKDTDTFARAIIQEARIASPKVKIEPPKQIKTLTAAEEVAQKNMQPGEVNQYSLKNRKVEPEYVESVIERPPEPEIPVVERPRDLQEPVTESDLDLLVERPETKKALGENISKDIEASLESTKGEYEPLYEMAEEAAELVETNTGRAAKRAWDKLKDLRREGMRTQPERFAKTEKILQDVLYDTDSVLEWDGDKITDLLGTGKMSTSRSLELDRRLGKIINYDDIDPGVQDLLKGIRVELHEANLKALEGIPEAKEVYQQATDIFRDKSERFGADIVRQIRSGNVDPEAIISALQRPTNLEAVKNVVSPEQFRQIERELLSAINDKSYGSAAATARELRKYLSDDANMLLDEILLSKKPAVQLTPSDRLKIKENDILKKMSKPTKPTSLVNEWKTKRGRNEIKAALKNNPNKAEIVEFLERETLSDMAKEVVDDAGQVVPEKFAKLAKKNLDTIEELGGKDARRFFENIDKIQKQAKSNVDYFNRVKSAGKRSIGFEEVDAGKFQKGTQAKGQQMLERVRQRNIADAEREASRAAKIIERISAAPVKPVKGKMYMQPGRGVQMIDQIKAEIAKQKYPGVVKIENVIGKLKNSTKRALTFIAAGAAGSAPTAGAIVTKNVLFDLVKNPRFRNALWVASKTRTKNPYLLYAMYRMAELAQEEGQSSK